MSLGKYAVVILNWNGYATTQICIKHLLDTGVAAGNIVVVDNGSSDGSEEKLAAQFPAIMVLQSGSNLGYAGGNNVALRQIIHSYQYALVLNNDCLIKRDAIEVMVELADKEPAAGLITPKVLDGEGKILHAGGTMDWHTPFVTRPNGQGEMASAHNEVVQVDFGPGDCLLVRLSCLDAVGFIPEDYFLYYEDSAWNMEFTIAGYSILYCPQAVAIHEESQSTGGAANPLAAYYILRNKFYFIHTYGDTRAKVGNAWHWILSLIKNCIRIAMPAHQRLAKPRLAALRDVALQRKGKRA